MTPSFFYAVCQFPPTLRRARARACGGLTCTECGRGAVAQWRGRGHACWALLCDVCDTAMNQPALLALFLVMAGARAAALRRQQMLLLLLLAGPAGHAYGQPAARVAGVFAACAQMLRHGGGAAGRVGAQERGDTEWQRRVFSWPERKFRRYYRLKRKRFRQLCEALSAPEHHLFRAGSRNGKVLSIEQVVAACLRRLASTSDFFSVAEEHGMAESTLHDRFPLFLRAMRQVYEAKTIALPTAAEMAAVMAGFEAIAGFPQCCGALDGTHIPWRAPGCDTAMYLNHKGYVSINTQLMVDSTRLIRDVFTGFAGGAHDARVFDHSSLGRKMRSGEWPPPSAPALVEGVRVLPFLVVDAAYPDLDGRCVKPYPGGIIQDGHPFKRHFNYKQSGTRMPVEHVNSMLKRRWRILYHGCEIWSLRTMVDVIMVCCVLHNLCVLDKDAPENEIWGDEDDEDANRLGNDVDPSEEENVDASGMYAVMLALGMHTRC